MKRKETFRHNRLNVSIYIENYDELVLQCFKTLTAGVSSSVPCVSGNRTWYAGLANCFTICHGTLWLAVWRSSLVLTPIGPVVSLSECTGAVQFFARWRFWFSFAAISLRLEHGGSTHHHDWYTAGTIAIRCWWSLQPGTGFGKALAKLSIAAFVAVAIHTLALRTALDNIALVFSNINRGNHNIYIKRQKRSKFFVPFIFRWRIVRVK